MSSAVTADELECVLTRADAGDALGTKVATAIELIKRVIEDVG